MVRQEFSSLLQSLWCLCLHLLATMQDQLLDLKYQWFGVICFAQNCSYISIPPCGNKFIETSGKWSDHLSTNPKSEKKIYSLVYILCVEKHFQAIVDLTVLAASLSASTVGKTSFFSCCSFTEMTLFSIFFLNHQREECGMLFSLLDIASWQRTLKLCHERKLSKTLLWFSVASLCCFYWGTFWKARIFSLSLAEEHKIFG